MSEFGRGEIFWQDHDREPLDLGPLVGEAPASVTINGRFSGGGIADLFSPAPTEARLVLQRTWRRRLFSWPWRPWHNTDVLTFSGGELVPSNDPDCIHLRADGVKRTTARERVA